MNNTIESIRFTRWLVGVYEKMDFETFESEIVKKFEDDAESLNIQELYTSYYLTQFAVVQRSLGNDIIRKIEWSD